MLQNLENYLRNHNGGAIIEEENRNHFLSAKSQKSLLNRLKDFTEVEYSSAPTRDDLIAVSRMTVLLFPSMKENFGALDGIVSYQLCCDANEICVKLE